MNSDTTGLKAITFAYGSTASKLNGSGEAVPNLNAGVTVSTWADLKSAVNEDNAVIALGADVTSSGGDSDMIKVNGKTVTIDLCGHTINRNRSDSDSDGHAFWVTGNGVLNLRDTYGSGKIEGGNAERGGAINVDVNATLNLYNVTLSGNEATSGVAFIGLVPLVTHRRHGSRRKNNTFHIVLSQLIVKRIT